MAKTPTRWQAFDRISQGQCPYCRKRDACNYAEPYLMNMEVTQAALCLECSARFELRYALVDLRETTEHPDWDGTIRK